MMHDLTAAGLTEPIYTRAQLAEVLARIPLSQIWDLRREGKFALRYPGKYEHRPEATIRPPFPIEARYREVYEYVNSRIDQVIRQMALEVGILELRIKESCDDRPVSETEQNHQMEMVRARFWAADAAAAEPYIEQTRRA